jgi:hypothetical protein
MAPKAIQRLIKRVLKMSFDEDPNYEGIKKVFSFLLDQELSKQRPENGSLN